MKIVASVKPFVTITASPATIETIPTHLPTKCELCLKDLEVITPASATRYVRYSDWKRCAFFRENSIHGYHQCLPPTKCELCLKDLEVITPASATRYVRYSDWKRCAFFRENSIHGYHQCLHAKVMQWWLQSKSGWWATVLPIMRVSRSEKDQFRPFLTYRRKYRCWYFQWAVEEPYNVSHQQQSLLYTPDTHEDIPAITKRYLRPKRKDKSLSQTEQLRNL